MLAEEKEILTEELVENEKPAEETHDIVPAADIKPEDLKDEDITDEMIDEFTKSNGKTLKIAKKSKVLKEKIDSKTNSKLDSKPEKVIEQPKEKPESKEGKETQESKESKEEKKINYGAFYEQKQLRIAAEKKLAEQAAEIEKLKNPPKQIPAYEEDPLENTNQRLTQIEKDRQNQAIQQQNLVQEQQFMNIYAQSAQEFAKTEPNFQAAYNYLIDSRYRELTAYGFTPEEVNKTITEEEKWMVGSALNKGQNPAAQLFQLAKLRGYTIPNASNQKPATNSNSQKLENIERGQDLNKSITGGKIAGQDLTEEVLSDIDNYNPFDNLRGKTTLDVLFDNMRKGH